MAGKFGESAKNYWAPIRPIWGGSHFGGSMLREGHTFLGASFNKNTFVSFNLEMFPLRQLLL